jgi:tetratricopeptide (TPR) repeat protein
MSWHRIKLTRKALVYMGAVLLIGFPTALHASQKLGSIQQKSDATQQRLDAAARSHPDVQNLYNEGVAKAREKLLEEAIIDFSQAIRLDPNFVEAYVARGYAGILVGDKEAAINDFRMVERIYASREETEYAAQFQQLSESLQREFEE